MAETNSTLSAFFDGWGLYNRHIANAVKDLTPEQLELRVADTQRSAGSLTAHIVGTRAGWYMDILGEPTPELVAFDTWGGIDEPSRSVAELVGGLEATWQILETTLRGYSANDFARIIEVTRSSGKIESVPRQWVIWHLIEHDITHGGELFLTLGTYGLPTPDL